MVETRHAFGAIVLWTVLGAGSAGAVVSNCSQPVESVDACSRLPEDCWIENEASHLPWLAPPKEAWWTTNPATSRAFCSPANATTESDGHWYSYSIYLPAGYDLPENVGVRYPVVYWLHGTLYDPNEFSGRGSATAKRVHKRTLQRHILPTIYVTPYGGVAPEVGEFSWIDQWTDGGVDGERPGCDPLRPDRCFRADSALDELVRHVDANYRTIARRQGRGIEGFSRGGGYALQRAFRKIDGEYAFGSVASSSAATRWEASAFAPSAEELVADYVDTHPADFGRPIELMLLHGDLELDQSALPTVEFSDFLGAPPPGVEPVGHSIEHVVPACGEERAHPCGEGSGPPVLGHDQPRMDRLRGDAVVRFHDENFQQALTASELDALDTHRLPCADKLDWVTEPAATGASHEAYLAGDFDGDGCDSIAVRHDGSVFVDNGLDAKYDEEIAFGPDGAGYFAIDWRDEGVDDLGYAAFETAACPTGWEVRFWTEDRDGDGHGPEDEPFFCFPDAPEDTDILVGDYDGDWRHDVAYRDGNVLHWTPFLASGHTGEITGSTKYGTKTKEDQHDSGRWVFGQEVEGFVVRRGNVMLFNEEQDGAHDTTFKFGTGAKEDQYLFGDWNGDGRTNVGVRRCNQLLLDVTFDGAHDYQYYFGWGTGSCHCTKTC